MGTLYVDTGGSTTNSGSTDQNAANLTGSAATVVTTVVTLDGSPDLSGLVTSGATQSSIHINDATNSNMKIFWITAFDNTAKTVTVHAAPTGVTSSVWAIGGRHVLTNASIENTVRAGDTVILNNTPASAAAARWTFRNAGDETSGRPRVRGKTGTRPVLTTTNTSSVVGVSAGYGEIENVELDQDGASGNVLNVASGSFNAINIKVSDGGGIGVLFSASNGLLMMSEVTGVGGDGSNMSGGAVGANYFSNYIHDVGGDAIETGTNGAVMALSNILDTAAGRGMYLSGGVTNAPRFFFFGNTVYGCGDSGFEVVDAGWDTTLYNNIFQDNGNAAGEYNVEWQAGTGELLSLHGYNCFYKTSNNLSGLTANATETTSDPLLTNPSGGDFTLGSSSPCKGTGFPGQFLGGSLGYLDMGAVQRQEAGGGATTHAFAY